MLVTDVIQLTAYHTQYILGQITSFFVLLKLSWGLELQAPDCINHPLVSAFVIYTKVTVICRNKTPPYWCRNKTLSERPILPSRENFWLFWLSNQLSGDFTYEIWYSNILLRSNVVKVYCEYIYKAISCYFTFIFDLEPMTLNLCAV